jgi:hypothetical protein
MNKNVSRILKDIVTLIEESKPDFSILDQYSDDDLKAAFEKMPLIEETHAGPIQQAIMNATKKSVDYAASKKNSFGSTIAQSFKDDADDFKRRYAASATGNKDPMALVKAYMVWLRGGK